MATLRNNSSTSLVKALSDFEVKSSVESCVRELLSDVELANRLQEQMEQLYQVQLLQQTVAQQAYALEESRAVEERRKVEQIKLADELIREVWSLSEQLGVYSEIQKEHQALEAKFDETTTKLMQAEEELKELKEKGVTPPNPKTENEKVESIAKEEHSSDSEFCLASTAKARTVEPEIKERVVKMISKDIQPVLEPKAPVEDDKPPAATVVALPPPIKSTATIVQIPPFAGTTVALPPKGDFKKDEPSMKPPPPSSEGATVKPPKGHPQEEDSKPAAVPSIPAAKQIGESKPAVSLDLNAEPTQGLTEMDTKILMEIFGFLDALDILNTAQVNISMYSRVDSLFGLGGGGGGASAGTDGDTSTIATIDTATPVMKSAAHAPVPTVPTASQSIFVSKATTSPSSAASAFPSINTAGSFGNSASAAATEGIRGFFSMLQGPVRKQTGTTPSTTPTRASTSKRDEAPPMNAAMANSMASKLSDAELNAIILMTERLRQKEQLAEKLTKDRQDMEAQLDGVKAVKQFLVDKVRTMEEAQAKQEKSESLVAHQVASDQEIITFLDSRVKTLEQEATKSRQEQEELRAQMARNQEQANERSIIMGDMLQFERERWSESEREWKATKKVLVKEVKSCRSQVAILQAERDGYREQNNKLRRALLSFSSSSNNAASLDH